MATAITRTDIMQDPSVHNLTKAVLKLTETRDPVDRFYDVLLALDVLRAEMDKALGIYT